MISNPWVNRINNTICFLIAAATVAFIGIHAAEVTSAIHSGTQSYIRK
jgi:hypothetical protein